VKVVTYAPHPADMFEVVGISLRNTDFSFHCGQTYAQSHSTRQRAIQKKSFKRAIIHDETEDLKVISNAPIDHAKTRKGSDPVALTSYFSFDLWKGISGGRDDVLPRRWILAGADGKTQSNITSSKLAPRRGCVAFRVNESAPSNSAHLFSFEVQPQVP
jgi:hypothetical protein